MKGRVTEGGKGRERKSTHVKCEGSFTCWLLLLPPLTAQRPGLGQAEVGSPVQVQEPSSLGHLLLFCQVRY